MSTLVSEVGPILDFFLSDVSFSLQWLLVTSTVRAGRCYWNTAYQAVTSFYNVRLSCKRLAEWGNYGKGAAMWDCLVSHAPDMCSLTTLRQAHYVAGSLDPHTLMYHGMCKYCNACHDNYDWSTDYSSTHDNVKFCHECVANEAMRDICEHCGIHHQYMNPRAFVGHVEWLTRLTTPHFSHSLIIAALSYILSPSTLMQCGCRYSGSRCHDHSSLTTEKRFSILIKLAVRYVTGKWILTVPRRCWG